MPAYLTHKEAGDRVLEAVSLPQRAAFLLGCQGPDMLFFHNYQPWRRDKTMFALGVLMHNGDTRALLKHLIGFVRGYTGADRDELVSYAAGFLTHYAIDKNAHPFVYGKTGEDDARHQAIEYMWDSYTATERWGIEPSKYPIGPEVMYGRIGAGICDWYRTAADELYGLHITPEMVQKAQKQFAFAKQTLGSIGPMRSRYLAIIGRMAGFDTSSLLYPSSRDESLFSMAEYADMKSMVDEGVRQAQQMIPTALAAMNGDAAELPAWFGDTDFAGEPVVRHG
jgi:hypothetical protein